MLDNIAAVARMLDARTVVDGQRRGVRLTFEDRGPGIADIQLALKDGYTTGTSLGPGARGHTAPVQ